MRSQSRCFVPPFTAAVDVVEECFLFEERKSMMFLHIRDVLPRVCRSKYKAREKNLPAARRERIESRSEGRSRAQRQSIPLPQYNCCLPTVSTGQTLKNLRDPELFLPSDVRVWFGKDDGLGNVFLNTFYC